MSLLPKQQGQRWMEPKDTHSQLVLAMRLDAFQRELLSRIRLQKTAVEKKNKTQEQCQRKAGVVAESQPILDGV